MSESVVSAKRGWVLFGAKPAQSETPVRAAAKRRPPGRGRSGTKTRSLQREFGLDTLSVSEVYEIKGGTWMNDVAVLRGKSVNELPLTRFRRS